MTNSKDIRSRYVLRVLEDHCLNGDAYVAEDVLFHHCKEQQRGLSYETFRADLAEQIRLGYIYPEGSRLYAKRTWRYEEDAAKQLSAILQQPRRIDMTMLSFDIIAGLTYTASMAYLLHELRALKPEARHERQTVPMLLAVTVLYVVVIWKTHVLAAIF